eukprot:1191620-Prorocentrum_minimum.AAC.6
MMTTNNKPSRAVIYCYTRSSASPLTDSATHTTRWLLSVMMTLSPRPATHSLARLLSHFNFCCYFCKDGGWDWGNQSCCHQ